MRAQLSLALTSDILTLALSQAERPRGWLSRLGSLLGPPSSQAQARLTRTTDKLVVTRSVGLLVETLDDAWTALKKRYPHEFKAPDLTVQLGLAHAHLGLIHLADKSLIPAHPAAIDAYVEAWIRQMWGMDPANQIIRWDRAENDGDILISCVDRSVYVELEQFARRHGLRFVSCKPAVLGALDLPAQPGEHGATSNMIAWTEPSVTARRSPLVQLLHCQGSQPKALWRGWLPAPGTIDEPDSALQGALRRFMAAGKLPLDTPAAFMHWDQAVQPPQTLGAGT